MGKKHEELKVDIFKLFESNGETVQAIASRFGIPMEALMQWKREFHEDTEKMTSEKGNSHNKEFVTLKKETA